MLDLDVSPVRLGVILPSVNTVVEAWYPAMLPPQVSMHVARMLLPEPLTAANVEKMDRLSEQSAFAQIQGCRPHSIVYGCFASSVLGGTEYDARLRARLEAQTGVPVATAASALLEACRTSGLRRVGVCSPYPDDLDLAERQYLAAQGLEILGHVNLRISNSFGLSEPDANELAGAALSCLVAEADGIVMTCMNARTHLVIEQLEKHTRRPVVTCTQSVLWKLLRMAGIRAQLPGLGQLFNH